MKNFTYTVDNENVVKIWDGVNNDAPVILQPTYPDGSLFENKAEAETWAETWITNWHNDKQQALQEEQRKQEAVAQLKNLGFSEEEISKIVR